MLVRPWSALSLAAVVTLAGQAYANSAPAKATHAPHVAKKVAERSSLSPDHAPAVQKKDTSSNQSRPKKARAKAHRRAKHLHRAKADHQRETANPDKAPRLKKLKKAHGEVKRAVENHRAPDVAPELSQPREHIGARKRLAGRKLTDVRKRQNAQGRNNTERSTITDRNSQTGTGLQRADRRARDAVKKHPQAARHAGGKLHRAEPHSTRHARKARNGHRADRKPGASSAPRHSAPISPDKRRGARAHHG